MTLWQSFIIGYWFGVACGAGALAIGLWIGSRLK